MTKITKRIKFHKKYLTFNFDIMTPNKFEGGNVEINNQKDSKLSFKDRILNVGKKAGKLTVAAVAAFSLNNTDAKADQICKAENEYKSAVSRVLEKQRNEIITSVKEETNFKTDILKNQYEKSKIDLPLGSTLVASVGNELPNSVFKDTLTKKAGLEKFSYDFSYITGLKVSTLTEIPGANQSALTSIEINKLKLNIPFKAETLGVDFTNLVTSLSELIKEKYDHKGLNFNSERWKKLIAELTPNDDEADVLNKFIESIDLNKAKPLPLANAMVALMTQIKFSQDLNLDLTPFQRILLNADSYAIKSVQDPERAFELARLITLPSGLKVNNGKENRTLDRPENYVVYPFDIDMSKTYATLGINHSYRYSSDLNNVYISLKKLGDKQINESFDKMSKISQIEFLELMSGVFSDEIDVDSKDVLVFFQNLQENNDFNKQIKAKLSSGKNTAQILANLKIEQTEQVAEVLTLEDVKEDYIKNILASKKYTEGKFSKKSDKYKLKRANRSWNFVLKSLNEGNLKGLGKNIGDFAPKLASYVSLNSTNYPERINKFFNLILEEKELVSKEKELVSKEKELVSKEKELDKQIEQRKKNIDKANTLASR